MDGDQQKKVAKRASVAALLLLLPKALGHENLHSKEAVPFDDAGKAQAFARKRGVVAIVATGAAGIEMLRKLRDAGFNQPAIALGADQEAVRAAIAKLGDVHPLDPHAAESDLMHTLREAVGQREALASLRGNPSPLEHARALEAAHPRSNAAKYAAIAAVALLAGIAIARMLGAGLHPATPSHGAKAADHGAPDGGNGGNPSSPNGAPPGGGKGKGGGGGAGGSGGGGGAGGGGGSGPSGENPGAMPSGDFSSTPPSMSPSSPGPKGSGKGDGPNLPPDASLVVVDGNGNVVLSQNGNAPRTPASTLKLVVAATASAVLGPQFRFQTAIGADRAPQGGNVPVLLVRGDGDPTLASADLAAAARTLHDAGVRHVGEIDVATKPFEGPEQNPAWSAEDKTHSYGAGSAAVSLNGNLDGGVPVRDIPAFVGDSLGRQLAAAGITFDGHVKTVADGNTAWVGWNHRSAALPGIEREMLFESDNLVAEQLLRRIGVAKSGVGSVETGTQAESDYLHDRGISTDGMQLVDGSGLSEDNRITASTLATMLAKLPPSESQALYNDLPVLGREGTLAGRVNEANAHVKDGRLHNVDALAGYVDTTQHGRAAFSFMVNRENLSRAESNEFGDSVVLSLSKY